MVSINYSAREVSCKIVYYGPGLSGKTTNLQYVHSKVPGNTRGDLISLATEADRTLYFDFLPINIGTINGFAAKFQLYTVPGQVYYNATRKLVLRGVDGVVFVADSQQDKMDENIESLANLEDNLVEYGYDLKSLPMVIQYNKADLPGILSVEQLNAQLNKQGRPFFQASATIGNGVFDTLKMIIKLVLDKAKNAKPGTPTSSTPERKDTPKAVQPVDPQPAQPSPPPDVQTKTAVATELPKTVSPPKPVMPSPSPPVSEPTSKEVVQLESESQAPSQYRPYPGSTQVSTKENKISATAFSPTPAPGVGENIERNALQANGDSDQNTTPGRVPAMAPSLRRRSEKKKRGFFKRLFGIK
ncbi:MAG: GTPase domain-containing protein [candidate division Zixibacteria bacterium]|nr:GTPase domain-containing protein [candidate division Zixibacteria bacterium]